MTTFEVEFLDERINASINTTTVEACNKEEAAGLFWHLWGGTFPEVFVLNITEITTDNP